MQRREFITLLGGAATAWPLAAKAQQQRTMPVVGYFYGGAPEGSGAEQTAAFRKGLSDTGFVEGRNVAIEYRWGLNDPDRMAGLIADLVQRRVAVIATMGSTAATRAAKAATATIPIVFGVGSDPVRNGLVASFNRPGGNVTGFNFMTDDVAAKRLGLLRELLPGATRFALLVNPTNANAEFEIREAQTAAATIGRQIEVLTARSNGEIDTAFASVMQKRAAALLVVPEPLFSNRRVHLATLGIRHGFPVIFGDRQYAEAGGLMSYGSNVPDQFRQAGIYVGRVLKGEKPADLPVMQPTKFEFVINLQTAKTLGIAIPPTLLAIADVVIE
jgi:putative ABC transport system substrate-binding protein